MPRIGTTPLIAATSAISATSQTFAFSRDVPAGHTIIGSVTTTATQALSLSITDAAGNVYQVDSSVYQTSTQMLYIFHGTVMSPVTHGQLLTVSSSSTVNRWIVNVEEFDDVLTSSPTDVTATNFSTTADSVMGTGTTAATSLPSELIICCFATPVSRSVSPTGGLIQTSQIGTSVGTADRGNVFTYKYVTSQGAQTGAVNQSPSGSYAGAIVTYKIQSATIPHAAALFVGIIQSASGADSFAISLPAGVENGDFLLSSVAYNSTSETLTPPPGWNVLIAPNAMGSGLFSLAYRFMAQGVTPPVWTVTNSDGTTGKSITTCVAYRDVQSVNIGTIGTRGATSSTNLDAPSITTSFASQTVVGIYMDKSAATSATPPAGLTSRGFSDNGGGGSLTTLVADGVMTVAGPTGVQSALFSAPSTQGLAVLLELVGIVKGTSSPTADAGADQVNIEPWSTVSLIGSDTGGGGVINLRTWRQVSGTNVAILGSGGSRTFKAPAALSGATLTFGYSVTTSDAVASSEDICQVTVLPATDAVFDGAAWVPVRHISRTNF